MPSARSPPQPSARLCWSASVPAAPDRLARIGALLTAAVGAGGIPGAVAAVGQGPATLGRWAVGLADAITGRQMQADTVFDLASLTKVVATTTVTLALAGRDELKLGDPVAGYLPDASACRDGHVTIAHLLTHTSGLPPAARSTAGADRAPTCSATCTRPRSTNRPDPGSPTPTWASCSSARWWRRWRANPSTPPSAAW